MKKGLKRALSLLLAASVLIASTGIVIASHVCHESRKAGVTLYEQDGCCSKPGKDCQYLPVSPGQLKKSCCQISISYLKLVIASNEKAGSRIIFSPVPSIADLFTNCTLKFTDSSPSVPVEPVNSGKTKPGDKNFLHSIRLLLI